MVLSEYGCRLCVYTAVHCHRCNVLLFPLHLGKNFLLCYLIFIPFLGFFQQFNLLGISHLHNPLLFLISVSLLRWYCFLKLSGFAGCFDIGIVMTDCEHTEELVAIETNNIVKVCLPGHHGISCYWMAWHCKSITVLYRI